MYDHGPAGGPIRPQMCPKNSITVTCSSDSTSLLPLFERCWAAEFRYLNGHVYASIVQLKYVASIQPRERELERHLDAAHVPIVAVIDLRRQAADRRTAVPY